VLYAVFRALARTSLRWFYRDVAVLGAEQVPTDGPLLVAMNHPNALVDALVAVSVLPRRVTLTAKATLWENPALRLLLPRVGIVPLRRAQDERARGGTSGGDRNASSFAALLDALARGGAVLLFPEGISHDAPRLAPLKTGLARIALQARDERGVRAVRVLPVGLVFERKWQPRSRVLVQVGAPLALDAWDGRDPAALTAEVDARLRAVTLNFETAREEAETLRVARVLAAAFEGDHPLGRATTPLDATVAVARRVEAARARLAAGGALPPRAAAFVARLGDLRRLALRHGVLLEDAEIATGLAPGARFTLREGALGLLTAPVALWGAANHWLPLRLAWTLARRTSRTPEDPAMRTIVLGLGLTLVAYAVQTAVVAWLAGPWWALAYLASLPPSSVVRLRWIDRARRALRRARTYARFRRDPALRERFRAELAWLREESLALEADGDARAPTTARR
jgi:1-acyl-sn-glycerol-3-phosphate acyltransferase